MKEQNILKLILLECSRGTSRLWRNNVGAFEDKRTGRWVRFGVGGKGGLDLIGFKTVTITPQMVGQTVAIYAEIEVKRPGQKPTDDQVRRMNLVRRAGGLAGVASSPEEAIEILDC